jgi:acetolactate synthase-1/2/3 large subunit
MGFAIPQAIGVAKAAPDRTIYCVEGDGSLQHNIQELATLKKEAPNVRLFILDNGGYASIRNSQKPFGSYLGCDKRSGLCLPDIKRVLSAYKIEATIIRIDPETEIRPRLQRTINEDGSITPGRLEDIE